MHVLYCKNTRKIMGFPPMLKNKLPFYIAQQYGIPTHLANDCAFVNGIGNAVP